MRYCFAEFELDSQLLELRRAGEPLELQPKVLGLLLYLVENRGRVVTKEELLERLWPEATVSESSLTRVVSLARSALGEAGLIRTQHSYGYRFDAEVVAEPAQVAGGPWAPGRPVMAVLRFENLSGDPDQDYFAAGISEDLLTRLSAWRSFPLIACRSSRLDVERLMREQDVRYALGGTVQRGGDRVRVNAHLADASSGEHVWAERFDRGLRDIFAIQDEISNAIVSAIHPEVWRAERERAARREPQSLDAWDTAQRAWWHLHRYTSEDNQTARTLYERAVELDPRLVAAFYGISSTHYLSLLNGWTSDPERSMARMLSAAEHCATLDEKDPLAHIALGCAYSLTGTVDETLAAFELANELDPNSIWALIQLGTYQALSGRVDEGIATLERAMQLSADHPLKWSTFFGMVLATFAGERYEETLRWAERCLQYRPHWTITHFVLVPTYAQLGRIEEAREVYSQAVPLRCDEPHTHTVVEALFTGMGADISRRMREGFSAGSGQR